ncbi:MAG: MaoC/PaaZ C-terminal domain-containing protein [Candidatus Binatia bacterium]|nr:MaoC/PaaZ C-terminal domain-containing protein [Candidatus Binatia bacterium]
MTATKYFEDFVIGVESESGHEYVVTTEELKQMAERWDPQPFHLDENAPETKEFGGLITCSAHTFAIYTYLGSKSPVKTAAIAGLGFEKVRMLLPLRPGDRIRAVNVCLAARESRTKPDRGILTTKTILRNQNDEDVFSIEATVMVRKRSSGGIRGAS